MENQGVGEVVQDCLIGVDIAVETDSVSICFVNLREEEK